MKIVFIATSRVPSTTANSIQVMKVCQAFAQIGHEVRLLVPQQPGEQPGSPGKHDLASFYGLQLDFPVEWLPASRRLRRLHGYEFSWRAVKRAQALEADIVYAWPLQAALFALLRQFPVLLELHEPPSGLVGPLLFRLVLTLPGKGFAGNIRFLPITQVLADILARSYPESAQKKAGISQVVAPDGVDLERYLVVPEAAIARRELGLPDRLTAGYTGHLYPGRGMGLLVELARRFPQVNFLWVGGRPEDVAGWKERLAEQGLSNITLTGFIENKHLPLYQAAAEILLMPYERKVSGSSGGNTADFASPMKMFEYMACGRAIVSSALPAIGEVLNEKNSVLCPPEDVEAWAKAFKELLDDPEKRSLLARRARLEVERYTWQNRARRSLEGFYGS